jgi:CheY-like chemotaxis protein
MKKILIVDDEITSTRLLKQGLERAGAFEVREENRSSRVLNAVREFHPDLIVMDVCMPEMDGGEVASELRAHRQFHNLPIIFLTSVVSENEAEEKPLISGGFLFLAKPVNLTRLVIEIEKQLSVPAAAA